MQVIKAFVLIGLLGILSCASGGSINDAQHIVIWMQENRAFDHYYGTLSGVRGFNDRATPPLPNGKPVWFQPTNGTGDDYILPFPLQFDKTAASCMGAPLMEYHADTEIFNGGKMDGWNRAREPGFGMSYFNRSDLPYYYALADAFTVGDQYFQSTFTATNPNRLHLFTGSNGLSVPDSGYNMLDDTEYAAGFGWETMAETLMKNNITWQVIQELDNFDDNAFEWFTSFHKAKPGDALFDHGVMPVLNLVLAFEKQVANDALPQVTWLVGPTAKSEHAENHPADGEDLSARLLAVLQDPKNAAVYAKTVFILDYDEGGQFVDHAVPPVPAKNDPADGLSTVTTVGELTLTEEFTIPPGNPIGLGFRVPLFIISPWTRGHLVYSEVSDHTSVIKFIEKRFGVHCPNISPWRRAVVSDLTAAFDWNNPDYTWPDNLPSTAANVNASKWECEHLPAPTLPTTQSLPSQEPGTRLSRPLPYVFDIHDIVSAASFAASNDDDSMMEQDSLDTSEVIEGADSADRSTPSEISNVNADSANANDDSAMETSMPMECSMGDDAAAPSVTVVMNNTGLAGAHFIVFDMLNLTATPRKFTVEAGKALQDVWGTSLVEEGADAGSYQYSLSLYGPNGFVRQFAGLLPTDTFAPLLSASLAYDFEGDQVVLTMSSISLPAIVDEDGSSTQGSPCKPVTFTVVDNAYSSGGPWTHSLASSDASSFLDGMAVTTSTQAISVSGSGGWYDITVTTGASAASEMAETADGGTSEEGYLFCQTPFFSRRYMGRLEPDTSSSIASSKIRTSDPAMAKGQPGSHIYTGGAPTSPRDIDRILSYSLPGYQPRDGLVVPVPISIKDVPLEYRTPPKYSPSKDCGFDSMGNPTQDQPGRRAAMRAKDACVYYKAEIERQAALRAAKEKAMHSDEL